MHVLKKNANFSSTHHLTSHQVARARRKSFDRTPGMARLSRRRVTLVHARSVCRYVTHVWACAQRVPLQSIP